MAVFISAGHNIKGQRDPGAVSKYGVEAELTAEFRNMVSGVARGLGLNVINDRDDERLGEYLKRIKPGNGSVLIEFHFDAAANDTATGCTVVVGSDADRLDKLFANELAAATSEVLNIRNRGVIDESKSHRGKLAFMRNQGIVALLEIGFITNKVDMMKFHANKYELSSRIAKIVKKYEDLIA